MAGDQRPCRVRAGALTVEHEQRTKPVDGDEVDVG